VERKGFCGKLQSSSWLKNFTVLSYNAGMRIVIDAYQMRPNVTGTDRQARNILRELQSLDRENEYIVIVNKDEPFVSDVIAAPNFTLRRTHFRKRASWIFFGLPLLLIRLRADVFYSFHNFTAPGVPVCPSVVSAMDIIPFVYQKKYYRGFINYWVRRVIVQGYMRNAAKRGAAFWAISKYTAHEMSEFFHIPEAKIHVAYLQADPIFARKPSERTVHELKKRLGIRDGFVYAIGGAEPRKNNLLLIDAHRALPETMREQYPLVIAGAPWQGEDLTNPMDTHLKLAGYVSDEDHAALFYEATVFAWPSQYEGFGLPVLEAMTAGTPVLSSNATSMPEVIGDAGLMFDPSDKDQLVDLLRTILTDNELRDRLSVAGKQRAKEFSWKKVAELLHDLFGQVSKAA
jgi:glycosyltransferase involved in cell wall biosynthesis